MAIKGLVGYFMYSTKRKILNNIKL